METVSLPTLAEQIPDEAAAYEYLEQLRWQGRPVCPHCASIGDHYFLRPRNGKSRKTPRLAWPSQALVRHRTHHVVTGWHTGAGEKEGGP